MILDDKGVASAELIFVTLIFLVISTSFISLTNTEMDKTQTGELGHIRMIGERIAETINTVYLNGNGYYINLTMPNETFNYTAYVYSTGNMSIVYNNNNVTIKLVPKNTIQNKTLNKGLTYKVTNSNGTITFT